MLRLNHVVEPEKLWLTWQPLDENAPSRTRRVVGVVTPSLDRKNASFTYLKGTEDFRLALQSGFKGFPAFKLGGESTFSDALATLMRRLPPRNREDFSDFLAFHGLPYPLNASDFALLGYTGAKLPGDGFSLVPDFSGASIPCDYILEVAGTRHVSGGDLTSIEVGASVTFCLDADNPVDSDAVAVYQGSIHIGYLNRALRSTFHYWRDVGVISGVVAKKNGKPSRPLVYVLVHVDLK
jgi:hypothetical protein